MKFLKKIWRKFRGIFIKRPLSTEKIISEEKAVLERSINTTEIFTQIDESENENERASLFSLIAKQKTAESGLKIALVYKQMGICRALKGDWEDSLEYFSKAIDMTPVDEDLLHWRASVYASLNKYTEAIYDCERILKINPDFQEVVELRDESIMLSKT